MLTDCLPLASPGAGPNTNYVFWVRNICATAFFGYAVLEELRATIPGLPLKVRHINVIVVISSVGAVAFECMMSRVVGFPLPFMISEGIVPWAAIIVAMFVYWFGGVICANEQVESDLGNDIGVLYGQTLMIIVYPVFVYGFNAIDPSAQKYYIALTPILKMMLRNWISRFMGAYNDKKPENVVINIEFFNAIYVACCMQQPPSVSTTVVLFVVDWIQMVTSLLELNAINAQVTCFLRAIPKNHVWYGKTTVEVAICIIE